LRLTEDHNDRTHDNPIELLDIGCDSNPNLQMLWHAALTHQTNPEMDIRMMPTESEPFSELRGLGHSFAGHGKRHKVNGKSVASNSPTFRAGSPEKWFTITVEEKDGRTIACHSWNANVQWYKVRPETKVYLHVRASPGELDGFTARLWTMTRANEVQTFSQQPDIDVNKFQPCASLDKNQEDPEQEEILAVWEIMDRNKIVHRVAFLHEGFANEDSDM